MGFVDCCAAAGLATTTFGVSDDLSRANKNTLADGGRGNGN